MAGGMAIIACGGAAMGLVGGSGSALLLQMGARAARAELVKLQVQFKAVILETQADQKKAQQVITALAKREREVRTALNEERKLNDKNSDRIKEIERTLQAVDDALEWMREAKKAA